MDISGLQAEIVSFADQGGFIAVYDIIVLLKVVWMHEISVDLVAEHAKWKSGTETLAKDNIKERTTSRSSRSGWCNIAIICCKPDCESIHMITLKLYIMCGIVIPLINAYDINLHLIKARVHTIFMFATASRYLSLQCSCM